MSGQLATLPANHFDGRLDEVRKALPEGTLKPETLARVMLTAINRAPALRECSEASLLGCMMDLATIALVPNTPMGHAFLIPYGKQATLQIGYRGFAELAYRSGQVRIIKAGVVRDGDEVTFSIGTGEHAFVRHVPKLGKGRSEREVMGAWAAVEMMNGSTTVEVMDADELAKVERQANASKASPAWKNWGDEMRKKSVLKRLLKVLQIGSMETVAKAVEIDAKHSDFTPPPPKEHRLMFGEGTEVALLANAGAMLATAGAKEEQDEKGFVF